MAQLDHHLYDRPSAADAELAAASSQTLAHFRATGSTARLRLDGTTDITVPVQAIRMLADILEQLATGHAVSIVPVNKELTTQEAADMLNVSRPYLIDQLLVPGKLSFHKVGNRRKILLNDVLRFKQRQEAETDRIMAELTALSQNLDIVDR